MNDVKRKARFTGSGCQVASYVANMTSYIENLKCLNKRRIDDCLREVSFK